MVRLLMLALLILAGCNAKQSGQDVTINTSGIFTPVSVTYNNSSIGNVVDLGEFLIGSEAQIFVFTVRNNSLFPLTNLTFEIDNNESYGFNYQKDDTGKAKFPGKTGTCSTTLLPAQSCTVAVEFNTSITKFYEQEVSFKYLNYVEGASRTFMLNILAGNPASLIFENEETNYYFGELVGLSQIPIIERDIDQEYSQVLTVINAGDLPARNLNNSTIKLTQTCASKLTNNCPSGQDTAYRITHDCPEKLAHGESCQITLYFRPQNGSSTDPEFKNIRYNGVIKLDYLSSLVGTEGSLNGYATTHSVNIEAIFETSIESLIFDTKLVVGNRDVRSFRVNNRGFRSGYIRKIVTKDLLGSPVASCVGQAGSSWLKCYDPTLTTELTLAQYPFKIKDKDACLSSPMDAGKIIIVDQGCNFDIFFQPSTTYTTSRLFDWEMFADYDSLWKGNTTIAENQLHTYRAESLAAAFLVPISINLNSTPISIDATEPNTTTMKYFDAGRVGLMSPSYFRRRPLMITYQNIGGVAATAVVAKDGQGTTIPHKADNPAGISIGARNVRYYANTLVATNNCETIPVNATCTIQSDFAPVTFYDNDYNNQNMFDVIFPGADYLKSYKRFIMNYQDGSKYSDGNFDTLAIDSGAQFAESRLQMDLVEKGQLDDYSTQSFDIGYVTVLSDYRREIKFTNIGTKEIPYIAYVGNQSLKSLTRGLRAIPTNPAKLNPPDIIDCYNVFDFNYLPTDTITEISARSATWSELDVNSECILTLEAKTPANSLSSNDAFTGVSTAKEQGRTRYAALENTIYAWDFRSFHELGFTFQLNSYDGDLTDPTATNPLAVNFGKLMVGKQKNVAAQYRAPGKLSLYSPRPLAGSMLYRPTFARPSVVDEAGATIITASAAPENWVYSDTNETAPGFTGDDADLFRGHLTKNFLPSGLATLPSVSGYDHVYYMGSVPSGTTMTGRVSLANSGEGTIKITAASLNTIVRPIAGATQHFTTDLIPVSTPITMLKSTFTPTAITGIRDTLFTFSGTNAGTYAAELIVTYNDSVYNTTGPFQLPISLPDTRVQRLMSKKILVVAEVVSTPSLDVTIQDYDVTTDDLNPAVETLGASTPYTMSWFESTAPLVTFSSIKLATPARKDSFLKKRFTFTNNSATTTIEDVKLLLRTNSAAVIRDNLQSPTAFYLCMSGSQSNPSLAAVNGVGVTQPMCQGTCGTGPFNIAPGGSCYIEVRYQPVATTSTKSTTITAVHKVGTNRYVHRNIDMTFQALNPASVTISNRSTQIIRTSLGNFTSFNLDFGSVNQTTNPQVFTFNAAITGGWNRMIAFNNPTTTKASFLKTYQNYYKQFIDPLISDSDLRQKEPAPTDYNFTVGATNYALIWQQNYPSTTNPRIRLYANRECLVGDNTGVWFTKGFTGATCTMVPILYADINYINRTLSTNSEIDMDPNYVRLQYYSSNRTSTGAVIFHFTGNLRPNVALVGSPSGANYYQNVSTASTSGGQVTFKWNEMTAHTPSLGAIVGYRVYYSTTLSAVNSVFPSATTLFIDTPVNGTGIYQLTHTSLGTNRYMYYRIFPIRQNAAYTFSPNPFGLAAGRYLSDPNVPALTVVIPNTNFFYEHNGKYLIEKNMFNQNLLTHANAKTACTGRVRHSVTNGASVSQFNFAMINTPVWNVIAARPAESPYNLNDYAHWLDNSSLNIHTTLLGNAQYQPNIDLAYLNATSIFYIKKSGCGTNCSGNTAKGSAFGQPGYTSYVEPAINFAGARCFIQIP